MNQNSSVQRKTTLKWNKEGELAEIDMLRIIEKLPETELSNCQLSCEI
tara:strand:+ start:2433 stop:2576 length:144 start_codon:yes stop_codon:yes gene_type:complete